MKVLITGASGGIGSAACRKFLENGQDVIGMDRLPGTVSHERYLHIIHDIRNREYPDIPELRVLVNCAGIQAQSEEDIDVDLTATIALSEHYAASGTLKAVVNVASASGITGSEFPHYAAAKGGLCAYTKNLALRLAPDACVNSVCPGAVLTSINEHILSDKKLFDAVANESLLKKWSDPEEIAEWIYFLTVTNKSMTGQDLLIDNGEILKSNFIW